MSMGAHAEPSVSMWARSAEEPDVRAPLDGDAQADLAIVGGGFTGLSTALHAAERGVDALVIEAEHVGYGGSGRNVGLVNAGLWLAPQIVRQRLGPERGGALVEALGAAPAYVMALIERHQIRCALTRTGTLHAAHAPKGYRALAARAAEWRRLGAPVELLSREAAAAEIGGEAFYGALLDHRAGTLNPMAYARGLARAAIGAGARIATGAPARRIRPDGDGWRIETDSGAVRAKSVVIAAGAYADDLWPGLRKTVSTIHYFQLATAPLGAAVAGVLREGRGLWDTAPIMTSLRRDASNRLIVGSMGRLLGGVDGLSARWARRTLRRWFPALGEIAFEAAWDGRIAMTPDHLPRIHRLGPGVYAPMGYNGRGIAPGTVFGKALAELAAGGREAELPLAITAMRPARFAGAQSQLYGLAFAANQRIRSL